MRPWSQRSFHFFALAFFTTFFVAFFTWEAFLVAGLLDFFTAAGADFTAAFFAFAFTAFFGMAFFFAVIFCMVDFTKSIFSSAISTKWFLPATSSPARRPTFSAILSSTVSCGVAFLGLFFFFAIVII